VYTFPDQSSETILLNITSNVIGDFCRDRVYEVICYYAFPTCYNDLTVPICTDSCSEYFTSGICVEDLQNVLNSLITEGYLNTSLDELNCSLPHDVPFSNNCTTLTGKWIVLAIQPMIFFSL